MNDDCLPVEAFVDDLALGLVTGIDRAAALAHLEDCHSCRAEVASLTDVAETLLLLVPPTPPDPHFQQRVLSRIAQERGANTSRGPSSVPKPRRHRRRVRTSLAIAAAVTVLVALVAIQWLPDRSPPTEVAAPMVAGGDDVVGQVSLVGDSPTVVVVRLPGWAELLRRYGESPGERYWLELSLEDGAHRWVALSDDGDGSWRVPTELDPADVAAVGIVDSTGVSWCRAMFA